MYNDKVSYELMLKKNESIFGTKIRGRIIADPPDYVKVLSGVINYNLLKALKATVTEYFP